MENKNLNEIIKLRKNLEKLDEKEKDIEKKDSFFLFLLKSFLPSFIFLIFSRYIDLSSYSEVVIFVLIFIVTSILELVIIRKNKKEKLENIEKEKIKIQAHIFELSKNFKIEKD